MRRLSVTVLIPSQLGACSLEPTRQCLTPGLPTWCESPCGVRDGFDLVAQDEVGAGEMSLGGDEVFTQLCDGSGGAAGRQRVEPDSQRAVAGVDVATAGQRLADEGVCFVVGAGVAGVDADGAGQRGGGVEGGDTDGMGDQLGLYVQDLLAGVDLG